MSTPMATAADPAKFPPGPPPRKGLLDSLGYYWGFLRDPIGFVGDRFTRYGDIYYAPSKDGGLYVLRHPDHLREVLITQAGKFSKGHSAFRQMARFLGDGLLTSDGDTWKRHRRMIQPAFSRPRLVEYAAVMRDEADRTARRWRDGEALDLGHEMMELTLRIVSRTLFGHDVTRETDEVARAMVTFQDFLGRPDVLPSWMPSPQRRRLNDAVATIDRIMASMIAARRRETASQARGSAGDPAPTDLLQTLITAVDEEGDGGGLTAQEVRDHLVTLFLAGHETTSHALTWTFYLLSQNPGADRALAAESAQVLGDRAAGYDDLERLVYTEQALKEAMRLYPPAYSVARKATDDLEIGGYPVQRGSEVVAWIYMAHRDARWFPEPDRFLPERFSPENEAKLPKGAYLPFGAGPRICIGKSFAMLEAKLILATIARRFRLELAPGQRVDVRPRITLTPRYGMRMIVRARRD
jgi:cytochrome P450